MLAEPAPLPTIKLKRAPDIVVARLDSAIAIAIGGKRIACLAQCVSPHNVIGRVHRAVAIEVAMRCRRDELLKHVSRVVKIPTGIEQRVPTVLVDAQPSGRARIAIPPEDALPLPLRHILDRIDDCLEIS